MWTWVELLDSSDWLYSHVLKDNTNWTLVNYSKTDGSKKIEIWCWEGDVLGYIWKAERKLGMGIYAHNSLYNFTKQ